MKFRAPESGNVFDDIDEASMNFCGNMDSISDRCICPIWDKAGNYGCQDWCRIHPKEAANLMGYEVLEDDIEHVEAQKKKLGEYTLAEASEICRRNTDCIASGCQFISGDGCILTVTSPSMWDLDGKKKLTDKELNICKLLGAKWVSCDDDGEPKVDMWREKPVLNVDRYYECDDCEAWISTIKQDVFPSLNPGDCICVEEVVGNE